MKKLTIAVSDPVHAYLGKLKKLGLYGVTEAEVAERLICDGVRGEIVEGLLKKKKAPKQDGPS